MTKKKSEELAEISQKVSCCQNCPLFKKATRPVPGEGNADAEIMFIGEGPGFHEDQQGRPFVGQAGKLLDELLSLIKIKREEVFITNVVKHRPPENREPLPEEIDACRCYLDGQIAIIQPRIIVTLGRFSLTKFFPEGRISQFHGQARFIDFLEKKYIIIPLFHPAAALRRGEILRLLKEDFIKIPQFLKKNETPVVNLPLKEENKEENKEEDQLSLL